MVSPSPCCAGALASLILLGLCLCAVAPGLSQADPSDPDLVTALGDRILACRTDAGLLLMVPPAEGRPAGYLPYFADVAAYGLFRAHEVTASAAYPAAADACIDWYRAHQQLDGAVTDDTFAPGGTLSSTGDVDSTDSYAAMYLWVLAERHQVAPDSPQWLRERELTCFRAVSAILLTLQDDGLTTARPSYPIEYTMDNAEVVVGLRSAGAVFEALGNAGMASHVRRLADRAEKEVRTLYRPEHGYFAWHRDLQGQKGYALEKRYPDVMAQEPDRSVFAKVGQLHLAPAFEPEKPWEHVWYGLAAQRVGGEQWMSRLVLPLNSLTRTEIATFDSLRCSAVLEAITGGTRP